jgi:hypothetical protein
LYLFPVLFFAIVSFVVYALCFSFLESKSFCSEIPKYHLEAEVWTDNMVVMQFQISDWL